MKSLFKISNPILIAIFIIFLSACGGDGGRASSSSSVTTSSSESLSLSSQHSISSQSSESSNTSLSSEDAFSSSSAGAQFQLTLKGVVTDDIIANALVSAWVGNTRFDTEANEQGEYEITLTINESKLDDLVYLEAKGQGAQEHVLLASQLISFRDLLAQAGDDKVLGKLENIRVNITNYSTAEMALLLRDGFEPGSAASYKRSLSLVSGQETLQLAALLKIIIDNPSYDLPTGVGDTYEFAKNAEMVQQYRDVQGLNSGALIDGTIQEIRKNSNLLPESVQTLAGTYWLGNPDMYSSGAMLVRFDSQGLGHIAGEAGQADMTWTRDKDIVQIDIAQGLATKSQVTIDGVSGVWVIKKINLSIIATTSGTSSVEYSAFLEFEGESALAQVQTTNIFNYFNLTNVQEAITPNAEQLVGEWWSSLNKERSESYVFNQDGTGVLKVYGSDINFAFSWSIVNGAVTLEYGAGSGTIDTFYLTADLDVGYQVVSQNSDGTFKDGFLVKRQQLNLVDNDILGGMGSIGGRFEQSSNYFYALLSDNRLIYNYTNSIQQWQLTGANSFSFYDYGPACTSSCPLAFSADYDVIAMDEKDNIFYVVYKFSFYNPDETPYFEKSVVLAIKHNLKQTRFDTWIQQGDFIQQDGASSIEWKFYYDGASSSYVIAINGEQESYSFVDGKIFLPETDRFISLVSAENQQLLVCLSNSEISCDESKLITLVPAVL